MQGTERRGNYLRLLVSLTVLGAMYPMLEPGLLGSIGGVQIGNIIWTFSMSCPTCSTSAS